VGETNKALGLFLLSAATAMAQSQVKAPVWIPTFTEEFNQKELEFPKWSLHDPWGHARNRESQAWIPEAVQLHDGNARIAVRREPARYDGQNREYTSGIITTLGSFAQTYGRFEIRCRLPAGRGFEPKFWLLPVSSGEIPSIDVIDAIGSEPARARFATRWGDEKTERSYSGSWAAPDLSKDFHTFAIEWDKDKVVWFIDGKERFRSTEGVPHQPMYLSASVAVGGIEAGWPDSTTPFPAFFDIDYIRVCQSPSNMH
jgi:beta-glucanase (GH16 family)